MTRFTATIDHGQGGQTTIEAIDVQEALSMAEQWAREGEWHQDGEVTVEVWDGLVRPHDIPDAESTIIVLC